MAKTKRTYQPSKTRRTRKLGFLVRMRSVGGKRVIARRRAKGRASLAVAELGVGATKDKKLRRRR